MGGSNAAAAAHPSAQSQQQQPMLRTTRISQSETEAAGQQQQAGAQVVRLSRKELRELSEDELADRLSKSNLSASSLAGLSTSVALAPGGSASKPLSSQTQTAPVNDATSSAAAIAANASQPLRPAAST